MIIRENQNIFDICLQEFGQLDNLFDLLNDNGIGLNFKLKAGQNLTINNTGKGNDLIKNFVILNNIKYVNGQGVNNPPLLGGDYNNDYNNDFY